MKQFETYEKALDYIHTRTRVGSQVSLLRMETLLKKLGNPQEKCKFVHIAGTNGKGSVTAMTAKVLEQSGYKTGRYVSPYVLDFRERMMVNGVMITEEELTGLVNAVYPAVSEMEQNNLPPTEFETVTAIAFLFFAQKECDIVCLEVGLGGKADSTNVIKKPLVCAITSIGLDHTAILGDTIEQIAGEKAGILKQNCPVVCGAALPAEALGVIYEQAAYKGCKVIFPIQAQMQLKSVSLEGTDFIYCDKAYHTSLIGVHQMINTVTVIEICKILITKGYTISDEAFVAGIAEVFFPARLQVMRKNPVVLLDGGHNPQGIAAAVESVKLLGYEKLHIVTGMMRDKDCADAIANFFPIAASVRCVTANDMPRALKAEELAQIYREAGANFPVYACGKIKEAVDAAVDECKENQAVLICGSLYLAEQVEHLI